MNRLDRHGFAALLAWLLCSVAYLWTAQTIALEPERLGNLSHHYEYLVDGFLSGHLHLSVAPAKELLALPNPWDPALNDRYRLGDASLFDGKYYLYFGPTPALLLMLPWKALTGSQLPQWLACGLIASAGLAALALLLSGLRRRYFPSVTPTQLFFVVVIGGVSWLPVVLRRSAFGNCQSSRRPHCCGGASIACGDTTMPAVASAGLSSPASRWPSCWARAPPISSPPV